MNYMFDENLVVYLTSRRMSSLGNLAKHFGYSYEELVPVIQQLVSKGRLRLSSSRCGSDCDSCHDCQSNADGSVMTEQTIAISLKRKDSNR